MAYHKLTFEDRKTIARERLLGRTLRAIAEILGCTEHTIFKELQKGKTPCGGYDPALAQAVTDRNIARRGRRDRDVVIAGGDFL